MIWLGNAILLAFKLFSFGLHVWRDSLDWVVGDRWWSCKNREWSPVIVSGCGWQWVCRTRSWVGCEWIVNDFEWVASDPRMITNGSRVIRNEACLIVSVVNESWINFEWSRVIAGDLWVADDHEWSRVAASDREQVANESRVITRCPGMITWESWVSADN